MLLQKKLQLMPMTLRLSLTTWNSIMYSQQLPLFLGTMLPSRLLFLLLSLAEGSLCTVLVLCLCLHGFA